MNQIGVDSTETLVYEPAKLLPDVWKREHPDDVRVYRHEESRYKSDRKQLDRARRIIAAKLKRQAK